MLYSPIMSIQSKLIGKEGEDAACRYIESLGWKVLDRNFCSSQGEIDIVAKDGQFLVFVEVKNYSFASFGTPVGAIRAAKKKSIIHAASTYLHKKNISNVYCRFDVISIYRNFEGKMNIELYKDAFQMN